MLSLVTDPDLQAPVVGLENKRITLAVNGWNCQNQHCPQESSAQTSSSGHEILLLTRSRSRACEMRNRSLHAARTNHHTPNPDTRCDSGGDDNKINDVTAASVRR